MIAGQDWRFVKRAAPIQLYMRLVRSWPAVRTVSLDLTASDSRYDCFRPACNFSFFT